MIPSKPRNRRTRRVLAAMKRKGDDRSDRVMLTSPGGKSKVKALASFHVNRGTIIPRSLTNLERVSND